MARKNDGQVTLYDEQTLNIGIKLYKMGEPPLELLYHLLSSRRLTSFSIIVIQTFIEDFGSFLKKNKRKTDLLFNLNPKKGIYALVCQETQVDGGFYFLRRLTGMINREKAKDIRACIVGVESTRYPVRDLLFIVMDAFVKVRETESEDERIYYKTVK
jgi:hypothetical protein